MHVLRELLEYVLSKDDTLPELVELLTAIPLAEKLTQAP